MIWLASLSKYVLINSDFLNGWVCSQSLQDFSVLVMAPIIKLVVKAFPCFALVSRDSEGHGNVYAKEPRMELAAPDAGWVFHERAEQLNGRLAMIGFVAAIATELISGEGLLHAIGL